MQKKKTKNRYWLHSAWYSLKGFLRSFLATNLFSKFSHLSRRRWARYGSIFVGNAGRRVLTYCPALSSKFPSVFNSIPHVCMHSYIGWTNENLRKIWRNPKRSRMWNKLNLYKKKVTNAYVKIRADSEVKYMEQRTCILYVISVIFYVSSNTFV